MCDNTKIATVLIILMLIIGIFILREVKNSQEKPATNYYFNEAFDVSGEGGNSVIPGAIWVEAKYEECKVCGTERVMTIWSRPVKKEGKR